MQGSDRPAVSFHRFDLMDFTLAQLSNENLVPLFNNAFYQAEELTSTNEDGEEESVAIMVYLKTGAISSMPMQVIIAWPLKCGSLESIWTWIKC